MIYKSSKMEQARNNYLLYRMKLQQFSVGEQLSDFQQQQLDYANSLPSWEELPWNDKLRWTATTESNESNIH